MKTFRYIPLIAILAAIAFALLFARGSNFLHSIFFFSLFNLSWLSFSAFTGLTLFLAVHNLKWSLTPFAFGAILILTGIILSLHDQHTYRTSGLKNVVQSVFAIAAFLGCVLVSNVLPSPYVRVARGISLAATLSSLLWSLGHPLNFFLPVMFFPESQPLKAQIIFCGLFTSGIALTFLFCSKLLQARAEQDAAASRGMQ